MQFESAELSLIGGREENQDRVCIVKGQDSVLLLVIDGMGGHADGARAAEVAAETIGNAFRNTAQPVFDPQGFLHRAIGSAHADLVALGADLSIEQRPRATCVVCLVQDAAAYWAHVGDSRIYLLRNQRISERTRDHSHVELLLQEGLISEDEIMDHPMRNFVECCLGGDAALPGMSVTNQKKLRPGDTVLACSDGFWSGLEDLDIAGLAVHDGALADGLRRLGELAVKTCGQFADNTSAVALRWEG
ncbi:MAG: PP2C family protein-serine/threonine phosphatase [Gammaproteobacteria bacterium]